MIVINVGVTGAKTVLIIYFKIFGIDIKVYSCCVHITSYNILEKEQLRPVQRYTMLGSTRKVRVYFQLI